MNKPSLKAVLVVLLGVAGFAGSYALSHFKNQYDQQLQEQSNELNNADTKLNDMILSAQYNQILSKDSLKALTLTDMQGESRALYDLIGEDDVVFYVESSMCASCVEKEFQNLGSLMSAYGKERVHLLFEGFNPSYLRQDPRFEQIRSQMYETNEHPWHIMNLSGTPSLVIVGRDGKAKTAYHAVKSINLNFELFQEVVTNSYAQ